MKAQAKPKRYKLKEAVIRLVEGHPLYSEEPLSSPAGVLSVMRRELSQYDREVLCVVNMNTRLQPINFNIVSVGELNQSIAAIPNILKSGLLSNAGAFLLLHNHPSGDVTPSRDDIQTTKRVIEAGKLMGIPCMDHIVIGAGNGKYCSMREENMADFSNDIISMTAEEVFRIADGKSIYDKGEKTMGDEKTMDMAVADTSGEEKQFPKRDEVTIKFGKGLAEPFTAKDGREFVKIMIPNQDVADKTPWASFVLPAKTVHENQYGKGLWAKIPAEGTTEVSKPVLTGQDETGKNIWEDWKTKVPNRELKGMVEAYKAKVPQPKETQPKESAREKLDALAKDTVAKLTPEKQVKVKTNKGLEL